MLGRYIRQRQEAEERMASLRQGLLETQQAAAQQEDNARWERLSKFADWVDHEHLVPCLDHVQTWRGPCFELRLQMRLGCT